MNPLRIKDNSLTAKEQFADISVLTKKICDKTLEQLEREGIFVFPELVKDSDDLTKDQMILQSVNDKQRHGLSWLWKRATYYHISLCFSGKRSLLSVYA